MNDLTRRLVIEIARQHKAAAKANGWEFAGLVDQAWWHELMGAVGWRIRQKLIGMLRQKCPHYFDEWGCLKSYKAKIAELDFEISQMVVEYLEGNFLERHPEWQLHADWGDLPVRIAEPQLELF